MSQRRSAVSGELHSSTPVARWPLPHSAPGYLTIQVRAVRSPSAASECFAMIISVQIAYMYFITPNTEPANSCFILKWYIAVFLTAVVLGDITQWGRCGRHSGLETGDKGCVWMQIGLVYTARAFALHKCYVHTMVTACKHAAEMTSLPPH